MNFILPLQEGLLMMKGAQHSTKVEVSVDTREELKKLKADLEAKNIDAVINWLLGKHPDQGDADGRASMEEEEADEPQERRKLNVRSPFYSLEILSERKGMLYYLTGFERSDVDLLVKRIGEVKISGMYFRAPQCMPTPWFGFWCCNIL